MSLRFPEQTGVGGANRLGGKGAALGALVAAGFEVPRFFVIEPSAFADRKWKRGMLKRTREAVTELDNDPEARFAVRSSAADEDGLEHSFAGQLDSFLEVKPADVPKRILDVVASGFGERVEQYRAERGLPAGRPPAVVVQRMVPADAAGVAFAVDPVSGRRDHAVVSAVAGLGESLVSGEADADTFRVDSDGAVFSTELADEEDGPVITNEQAADVAELARRASDHFGCPQDIEWAIADGRLHLLQSRAITSLGSLPDPAAPLTIWDNSNIAESYPGVTTPLTFTFARRAYAHVYRVFCGILGVGEKAIARHEAVFDRMLGLVDGRIYYNLISWYQVLAMLPGFRLNRRFMEQMMGVREEMPAEVVEPVAREMGSGSKLGDGMRLGRTLCGLLVARLRLPRQRDRFYRRVEEALSLDGRPPLESMACHELVAHYRELESKLLHRWDAPLVNDFIAMIAFGMLRSKSIKQTGDEALANALVADAGDIVSTEPVRRMRAMAEVVRGDETALAALAEGRVPEGEFTRLHREYLEKFGDRCLEELKLESLTLHDDDSPLLASVLALAEMPAGTSPGTEPAEERDDPGPSGWWLRRIAGEARARVRDRENLRFERTRVFGRVRAIFREMGRRLAGEGRLADAGDVFYLEVEELLGAGEGLLGSADLQSLAQVRRTEFDAYREDPGPPDRFSTRGGVRLPEAAPADGNDAPLNDGELSGIGCHPGVVEGVARVVVDPREADLQPGEVLVAEQTDPGWVMLFPRAAAVVVERGSLLSHSAIVARELGIPCVVSVKGLLGEVESGERLRVDGASGRIERLDR